jgi:predicted RNase H-like HicB family nuclease
MGLRTIDYAVGFSLLEDHVFSFKRLGGVFVDTLDVSLDGHQILLYRHNPLKLKPRVHLFSIEDRMVALCLENGITAQGDSKEEALKKLQEGIESVEEARKEDEEIYNAPLSIKELHEFLAMENREMISEQFELRAIHA